MALSELKKSYIAGIRTNTAYPTFRNLIQIFGGLFLGLGVVSIISGIVGALRIYQLNDSIAIATGIIGIGSGLILIVVGRLVTEVSSMIADIADSATDINSRLSARTPTNINTDSTSISSEADNSWHPSEPQANEKPLSEEEQEMRAVELLHLVKEHIASGAKDFAIDTLREIIRLYPATRAADKARSSLKGR